MKATVIKLMVAAALSAPLAGAAGTANAYDHWHDDGDWHEHHYHRDRYIVRYHLHGAHAFHAHGHESARIVLDGLRDAGAEARLVDGDRNVHYWMEGRHERVYESRESAHEFEHWLSSLDFDVELIEVVD